MIDKAALKLEYYANLEGTEFGEFCSHLLALYNVKHYGASDEFIAALEKEIKYILYTFETEYQVTKETETYTREVETLEYIGDYR